MTLLRLILPLLTFFGLTSCSIISHNLKQPPTTYPAQEISQALKHWNEQQIITLQRHQLIPIDYLEKNPHIKGLLINHYLGTGKTLLAIGFAERNPNNKVIILAPRFLEGHWWEELEKYGIKNKSRYRFIAHDAPESLIQEDLSQTLLIIDESHKLMERIQSQYQKDADLYSAVYFNLRKAHRILSLTGTPIYNDIFDLIYQMNLVSGKNLLPFNQEEFRIKFSEINTGYSYLRGHLLESIYLSQMLPMAFGSFLYPYLGFSTMSTVLAIAATPLLVPIIKTFIAPTYKYPLRTFTPEKLRETISQYLSYYSFDHDARFYPAQSLHEQNISYSKAQLSFLYKFYDSRLNDVELGQILKDGASKTHTENILLNSSYILDRYKTKPGAGREIGNLSFIESNEPKEVQAPIQSASNSADLQQKEYNAQNRGIAPGEKRSVLDVREHHSPSLTTSLEARRPLAEGLVFPKKFKLILDTIERSRGPVVVYSHYYYNGLLLFKQFLDAEGYQDKYKIFHPAQSTDTHRQILHEFNANNIKILLLHPDITEGISLIGTRQLHFLETPTSSAVKQQIIGRTVRYRSHLHLPKEEQKVDVYNWKYCFSMLDMNSNAAIRENWHHNFAELNYYSDFGDGRRQIDKNADLKIESPDERAYRHLNTLNIHIDTFREYVKTFSIENVMYYGAQ